MTRPTERIHPVTAGLIIATLAVAIAVRVAVTHGLAAAVGVAIVLAFACFLAWSVYHVWTLPPDAEEWDAYAEALEQDRYRF